MEIAEKQTLPKIRSSKWQRALEQGAPALLNLLCEYYDTPPVHVIVNAPWLEQYKVEGAYLPIHHALVIKKMEIQTTMDLLVIFHEFIHHLGHGIHHR
jgi:hypothetical protein